MARDVLSLSRENGKTVTCDAPDRRTIALIFWAKNSAPKLPLNLSLDDARKLRSMLDRAIGKAEEMK